MLRGAEKRMLVERTRDSRLFEEAYFVVRPEAEGRERDGLDMLWEANRILDSSMAAAKGREAVSSSPSPRRGLLRGLVWFLMGLGTGGGIASLLWVLL